MPELPDVEGFKRVLVKNGLRKTTGRVAVSDARILGKLSVQTFVSRQTKNRPSLGCVSISPMMAVSLTPTRE
jgi:hypothetical protein